MTHSNSSHRMDRHLSAILATTAAAFAIAAAVPAYAAAEPAKPMSQAMMPMQQHYAGIAYVTGGVGEGQAKAFEQNMHKYPLAIELLEKQKSAKRDEFTANANVSIADHTGKQVFRAKADGPFMLVQLEPGKYSVTASLGKDTIHRKDVMIEKGRTARETIVFPAGTN
ncbi:MAG: carboxypeptidase-like regulatory domain-containing protein [Gemmatimonadota bacterium]